MKTLTEFIAKTHAKPFKHRPQNEKEFRECIKAELEAGNCNLNCIDTSKVHDMGELFSTSPFNRGIRLTDEQQEKLDVSQWDVSGVNDMQFMFDGLRYFNSDLSRWNVSNVRLMSCMFYNCEIFNSDISEWDVSNVRDLSYMFCNCESFDQDLSKWKLSSKENNENMFEKCPLERDNTKWPQNY